MSDHDPWAWAHQSDGADAPLPVNDRVTAILITRNGAAWLPAALAGLAAQTRRPDLVVAVDNGSQDSSPQLLASALADGTVDRLLTGQAGWGFGQAVAHAVEQTEPSDWLWLLHDDAVAEPDCLHELLVHVGHDPAIDITGPKLLMPSRRFAGRQISELGVSIAQSGDRDLALASGEIDQGQHEAAPTLGVSTCGMLVRASTLAALDGFSPAIPLFRDGVELGWRANLAGHRVVTTPRAVMTHRQVGRAGVRAGVDAPTVRDRAYGMLAVAAHHGGVAGPLVALRLMLASLLRALFYLLGKAPSRARDELRALGLFVRSTGDAHELRRRVATIAATPETRARVRSLRPRGGAGLLAAWGSVLSWFGDTWEELAGSAAPEATLDELTGDDYAVSHRRTRRRPWLLPTLVTLVAVVVLALVAARDLMSLGHLAASHLLPAQGSLNALLRDYTAPIPGAPGQIGPPWLGLVGLFALLTFGQPELAVSLLLLGAVPLATLAAHFFLRRLANDRRIRLVGAVAYGLLPALLGAGNRGNLGLCVTAVVLPLLGMAVLAWRRRGTKGFESWRGAFAVGLGITVLAAFTPLVWLLSVPAGLVAVVVSRGRQRSRVLVALGVPLLLLSSWLPTLVAHPGRLLTGYEPVLGEIAPVATLGLLVGRTPGPGLPPVWLSVGFFAVLWGLGLVGLGLRARAARGWALLSLAALATAVAVTRVIVLVPAADEPTRPQAGSWLLVAFGALIALIVQGWDHVQDALGKRTFGALHLTSVVALAAASLATVAGLGWWAWAGHSDPIHRTTFAAVPAFARQESTQGLRTLEIDLAGAQPVWTLAEGDGSRLGDTERGDAFGGSREAVAAARRVVADLSSGRADEDLSEDLVRLGVGHVWVTHAPADVMAAIGSLPGLAQVTADQDARVWRVTPVRSRAMLVTGTQTEAVTQGGQIPAGASGRRLVLAEPADPRWRLTVGGEPVPVAQTDDLRQWFDVGARSGTIEWQLAGGPWWAWLQLAGLVSAAVLAAPSLRTQQRDAEPQARRAAQVEEVNA